MSNLDIDTPREGKLGIMVLVIVLHVAAILGLIRAFAPGTMTAAAESVLSTFNVTVPPTPTLTPPPAPAPKPAGAAAPEGKKANPRERKAPEPKLRVSPKTRPTSTGSGSANQSGAGATGQGSGAGGQGNGTGSGAGGNGQGGGGIAERPSVRSGELNNSADFPVPEGGRATRFGKSVTVFFTVTAEGRARDCSVTHSGVDAAATALVCPLVIRKIRFNPARRADGTVVEARYGYRVDFRER